MKRSLEKDYEIMIECAVLHYEKGIDQTTVAEKLAISQSQVSKLLRKAREEGIVQVAIKRPHFKELENKLQEHFGLRDVRIVQSAVNESRENESSLKQSLGSETARYFERVASDGKKIGIAGGQTMYEFVNALSLPSLRLKIYPLVAREAYDLQIKNIHASSLVSLWWCKYIDTEAYRLELPLIKHRSNVNRAINRLLEEILGVDFVFTSVGHVNGGSGFRELMEGFGFNYDDLLNKGVIGDFVGHPITKDGEQVVKEETRYSRYVLPMPLAEIACMAESPERFVILAAGGKKKLEAIAAALHGKLCNVLITDNKSAESLLQLHEKGHF